MHDTAGLGNLLHQLRTTARAALAEPAASTSAASAYIAANWPEQLVALYLMTATLPR